MRSKWGQKRFKSDGADFAIIKDGSDYRLYDYDSGHITKALNQSEMSDLVQRIKERQAEIGRESEMQALDKEIDNFAIENIPEYKKLSEAEKNAVRATLRYARAGDISTKDQILFGRIAAKCGMNIIAGHNIMGENQVAWYDGRNNIYLDADAPRTRSFYGLLGHEMWHRLFKSKKVKKLFMQALENVDPTLSESVRERYNERLKKAEQYSDTEIKNYRYKYSYISPCEKKCYIEIVG